MTSETHAVDSITKADSSVQMTQVAVSLLSGKGTVETAHELGIPKSRVERWRRDPVFKEIYAEVETKLSAEVITDAATFLQAQVNRLLPSAIEALETGLASEKVSDQLNAAGKILQLAKPARESADASVIPIEARIRARAVDVGPTTGD